MFIGPVGIFRRKQTTIIIIIILFWGCIFKPKMVVGRPGIVADTSYDVINTAPIKCLI